MRFLHMFSYGFPRIYSEAKLILRNLHPQAQLELNPVLSTKIMYYKWNCMIAATKYCFNLY